MSVYEVYWAGYKDPAQWDQAWCVRYPDGSVKQYRGFKVHAGASAVARTRFDKHPNGYLEVNCRHVDEYEGMIHFEWEPYD